MSLLISAPKTEDGLMRLRLPTYAFDEGSVDADSRV